MQILVWYRILSKVGRCGGFCGVHCKLEQLNYSGLLAVIKYGDGPRDAESTEPPGAGAMVKAAQKWALIPPQLMGGSQASCTVLTQYLVGGQRGRMSCLFLAWFLPFLRPCLDQLQGGIPSWGAPRAGSSCGGYFQVGKTGFRATLCPSNNAKQSQHPQEAALCFIHYPFISHC